MSSDGLLMDSTVKEWFNIYIMHDSKGQHYSVIVKTCKPHSLASDWKQEQYKN